MQGLLSVVSFISSHLTEIIVAVSALLIGLVAVLHALIALFMLIPGAQPEASLQKIVDVLQSGVDFIGRYSKK